MALALRLLVFLLGTNVLLNASDVSGVVVVRHKLTKKKVTASADIYGRGIAVPLANVEVADMLSYERNHVVVFIEDITEIAGEHPPIALEQLNRTFRPDLVVVPVGGSVSFPNQDPIFHNVFSLSKAKSFDLGNYPQGQTRTVVFSRPGVVMANCHLHPNMTAAILVTPNKWFIRADSSGRFSLKAVPPGKHMIVAWHKSAGFFRQAIVVEAGHDVSVSFDIPLDEDGLLTQNATRN